MRGSVRVVRGSIFDQNVDTIVNPANEKLLHGGGLAAEVQSRAGQALINESREIARFNRVPTGTAVATTGGNLPFTKVIHAVGPVYNPTQEPACHAQLVSAHVAALRVAYEEGLMRVGMPAISCGIFGYPVEKAAPAAVRTALRIARKHGMQIVFCLPEEMHYKAFRRALRQERGPWWRRQGREV